MSHTIDCMCFECQGEGDELQKEMDEQEDSL